MYVSEKSQTENWYARIVVYVCESASACKKTSNGEDAVRAPSRSCAIRSRKMMRAEMKRREARRIEEKRIHTSAHELAELL